LPIGLGLIAAPGRDEMLLAIAEELAARAGMRPRSPCPGAAAPAS
jgi:Asp-tRNA(Asn)/Glu-tRNA(Gln) amidotransferase A subunit family amidase